MHAAANTPACNPPALPVILRLIETQAIAFDTYAFVKRLTGAGMPEDRTAILAKGQFDLYERPVTRKHFEFTLKHELQKLRAELKYDTATVKAELQQFPLKENAGLTQSK